MDEVTTDQFARAMGFGRAADLFREELIEAARRAEQQRASLEAPRVPECEPWPPMRNPTPGEHL